jgi:hypothetical protein
MVDEGRGAALIGSSRQRALLVVAPSGTGYHTRIVQLGTVPGALAIDTARQLLIVVGARPGPSLLEEVSLADLLP